MIGDGLKYKPSRRWTIVVVRRFGRISSHEISGGWVNIGIVLVIILVLLSGYLVYENRNLRAERQRLLAQKALPPSEIKDDAPGDSTTETQISVVDEETTTTTTPTTTEGQDTAAAESTTTTGDVATPESTTTTLVTQTGDQPGSDDQTTPTELSTRVAINEVKLTPKTNPKQLKISFKLEKAVQGGGKITGYIFVIGKGGEGDQQIIRSFPSTAKIEEGRPVDYKRGIAFSIFQFKTIRGRIHSPEDLSEAEVLVYDQEGNLLFEQTYPVDSD